MIRFYNGYILLFESGAHLSTDEVWTEGGSISYVGPAREDMPEFQRQIDLRGDILIPGFKDAHTHTAMTFLRSFADDMPLDRWLSEKVWPNEARLTDEAVYDFTKLGIMEYLSSGITASFDMYLKNEYNARANIDAGFRSVFCGAFNDFNPDTEILEKEFLRFNSMHELISYRLGIHAEYTSSMERIELAAALADKYKVPCFTHVSETKAERDGCIERYGMTPPALLDSIGFFKYGGGGFHCVWMSYEDIELFARKGLWAITNPASNLKLASGIAPLTKMLEAGVPLAIGTDGAASNNSLDMFKEMYLATALQKAQTGDAAACPAEKILEAACVGGARAMGLTDCDGIAVGKKADLAVVDMSRPSMQPVNNPIKNIVYAGSRDCVRMTMVNGKILYENGEFYIGESPEGLYSRCANFMRGLGKL